MTRVDRTALVDRHSPRITTPHPTGVFTVGNGDLAITVDITGLQTFPEYHELRPDPLKVHVEGLDGLPPQPQRDFEEDDYQIPLRTQSTWGWYRTRGRRDYRMDEAVTYYQAPHGEVPYADRMGLGLPADPICPEVEAAAWLHLNPRRLHLGRLSLTFAEADALSLDDIEDPRLHLDLRAGMIRSGFTLRGNAVQVMIVVHPDIDRIGVKVESELLKSGLAVTWVFDEQRDELAPFESALRDEISWREVSPRRWVTRHDVEDASYHVDLRTTGDPWSAGSRSFSTASREGVVELTLDFAPTGRRTTDQLGGWLDTAEAARAWWTEYWNTGAIVSFEGSSDARAGELERRIVLSQYLTAVNCAGGTPPQETGLVYNTWEGNFHLEMHWWHAAHFPMWGRGALLERSLGWYRSILEHAKETAASQGYQGARWPKQTDPTGRESPSIIGSFIIWQQPHLIYFLHLLRVEGRSAEFVAEHLDLLDHTAEFMASFVAERDGVFHLPAPLVPAQESYLKYRADTEDPTFELAYWSWALRTANDLRSYAGQARVNRWDHISDHMSAPHVLNDSIYAGVASSPYLIREDHPSMLMATGWVPDVDLIDPAISSATLKDVLQNWDMQSTWGWDYPVMSMLASRVGDIDSALNLLLLDSPKNAYLPNGHNPQMPGFLSLYLPANGGLLAAVAHIVHAHSAGAELPAGWALVAEDFPQRNRRE